MTARKSLHREPTQPLAAGRNRTPAGSAAAESVKTAPLDSNDAQERLAAIEEQLATLQRIVSLKDDQIAALQGALAKPALAAADTGATAGHGERW